MTRAQKKDYIENWLKCLSDRVLEVEIALNEIEGRKTKARLAREEKQLRAWWGHSSSQSLSTIRKVA